jgi:hypothetical protein
MNRRTFVARVLGTGAVLVAAPSLVLEETQSGVGPPSYLRPLTIETKEGTKFVFDQVPMTFEIEKEGISCHMRGKCVLEAVDSFTVTRIYTTIPVMQKFVEVNFGFPSPLYIQRGNTLTLTPGEAKPW